MTFSKHSKSIMAHKLNKIANKIFGRKFNYVLKYTINLEGVEFLLKHMVDIYLNAKLILFFNI